MLCIKRLCTQANQIYFFPQTVIVTQNQISCRLPEYFEEPDSFIPERWLKKESKRTHPFLLLPFGHGPRSCIGRRLAEQNIHTLMLHVRGIYLEFYFLYSYANSCLNIEKNFLFF